MRKAPTINILWVMLKPLDWTMPIGTFAACPLTDYLFNLCYCSKGIPLAYSKSWSICPNLSGHFLIVVSTVFARRPPTCDTSSKGQRPAPIPASVSCFPVPITGRILTYWTLKLNKKMLRRRCIPRVNLGVLPLKCIKIKSRQNKETAHRQIAARIVLGFTRKVRKNAAADTLPCRKLIHEVAT